MYRWEACQREASRGKNNLFPICCRTLEATDFTTVDKKGQGGVGERGGGGGGGGLLMRKIGTDITKLYTVSAVLESGLTNCSPK